MAGDIQLTCSDCGQDFTFTSADQAFFQERGYSTPKRCKNCRMAKKNDQGGSGYRSAPAQGTPVICSGCGQPTTVPFEPRGDRPVYCRDCYQARKGSGGRGFSRARPLKICGPMPASSVGPAMTHSSINKIYPAADGPSGFCPSVLRLAGSLPFPLRYTINLWVPVGFHWCFVSLGSTVKISGIIALPHQNAKGNDG